MTVIIAKYYGQILGAYREKSDAIDDAYTKLKSITEIPFTKIGYKYAYNDDGSWAGVTFEEIELK